MNPKPIMKYEHLSKVVFSKLPQIKLLPKKQDKA
jgi:hypothetical protein